MAASKAYFYAIGRRKNARATVKLYPDGKGEFSINGKGLRDWADTEEMVVKVQQPLELLGVRKDFDIEVRVSGGGKNAQSESARLGIARALVKKEATFREQLKEPGYLTRDGRIKERKKPGLRRARRAPQFSKR